MRRFMPCLLLILTLGAVGSASGQPPPAFALRQNEPNPFCGQTRIEFALPIQVQVTLQVWNPDSTQVVRTLIQGVLPAGYHSIIWDGCDDGGTALANGSYPYVLTATEEPGGPPVFEASFRAAIDCPTPTRTRTWGAIKGLYKDRQSR
jgi:hypothetical protein